MNSDITIFIASIFTWLWAHHDKIWLALTVIVLFWVGAPKEKRAAIGSRLPRLAHLLDLFAFVGSNLLEARKQVALIKAGVPYTIPIEPPAAEPIPPK